MSTAIETTQIIICGCGPTGALLSGLLGRAGVSNICLDKEPDISTDPRGIALDEDGIRALQSLGLYDHIYSEIGSCMGVFKFISGQQHDLAARPFMKMDYRTSEGGTGHVGFICHKQPVLEKCLRDVIMASKSCNLRPNSTLTSISEDSTWVYIDYEDANHVMHHIRGKFLVGADGKTGYTRKQYLEPRGILMKHVSQ